MGPCNIKVQDFYSLAPQSFTKSSKTNTLYSSSKEKVFVWFHFMDLNNLILHLKVEECDIPLKIQSIALKIIHN